MTEHRSKRPPDDEEVEGGGHGNHGVPPQR